MSKYQNKKIKLILAEAPKMTNPDDSQQIKVQNILKNLDLLRFLVNRNCTTRLTIHNAACMF